MPRVKLRLFISLVLAFLLVFSQIFSAFADILSIDSRVDSVSGTGTSLKATVTGNDVSQLQNTNVSYSVYKNGSATNVTIPAYGEDSITVSNGVYQRVFDVKIDKSQFTTEGIYSAVAQAVYESTYLQSNASNIFSVQNAALLDFNVTDTVINPQKPVLYFTDKAAMKLYMYNYQTGTFSNLSFNLAPESMTFANNELYVSLLKAEHNSYMSTTQEQGAVAIVDPDTLTIKSITDIAIDPYDIVADNSGYIYISSGSSQWTNIKSFSRSTMQEVYSSSIRQESYIDFNPFLNRIYTITTDSSPRDITAYNVLNGKFTDPTYPGGYDSPYHGDFPMNVNMKISPDGKYIFNGAGTVFAAEKSVYGDMRYVSTLDFAFNDIAFDIANNRFYTAAQGNWINAYDYTTFKKVGSYTLSAVAKRLFLSGDKLVAVVTRSDGKNYLEAAQVSSLIANSFGVSDQKVISLDGNLTDTIYDSGRNRIYAADGALNNLYVIDAGTKVVTAKIKLNYRPSGLTLSEDGSKIYIVNDDENFLVTELDANTFANTRNLPYVSAPDVRYFAHRHIYNKAGKLYVIRGEWAPEVLVFDSNTFAKISYTVKDGTTTATSIIETGDIALSNDGNSLYYWRQYGWDAGNLNSFVSRYSINNNIYTKADATVLQYPDLQRDPLNTPIILMESDRSLIFKKDVFNMDNLAQVKGTFPEEIYAVNAQKGLAFGKQKVYGLNDHLEKGSTPVQNADKMFFTNDGNLFMIANKGAKIFYSDLSEKDISNFTVIGATYKVINNLKGEITFYVPNGTAVSSLIPQFAVSGGAKVTPASGVAQDFSSPVLYTVTALDGTTKTWKVQCNVEPAPPAPVIMKKISGKIELGPNVAPAGGITVTVGVYNINTYNEFTKRIIIPEGMNSIDYTLDVPAAIYQLFYKVDSSTGYLPLGYWNYGGVTKETPYSLGKINVTNSDALGKNLRVLQKRVITGTLYFPYQDVAPVGGAKVYIYASVGGPSLLSALDIPEGAHSVDFSLDVPNSAPYLLYYVATTSSLRSKYYTLGIYTSEGTIRDDLSTIKPTLIDVFSANYYGAKLVLLPLNLNGPLMPETTTSNPGNPGIGAGAMAAPAETVDTNGNITVKPVLDSTTNTATAVIGSDAISSALQLAAKASTASTNILIAVEKVTNADSYSVQLPVAAVKGLPENTMLDIATEKASVLVSANILDLNKTTSEVVSVIVADQSGDKPQINLSFKAGENNILKLNGRATVSIPYQPTAEEAKNSEHLVIQYVDSTGKIIVIPNGKYNKETGSVEFKTDRPGSYGIGYAVKTFADLGNFGWAQKEIEVMSAKNVINGTTLSTFDPEAKITRADYIMLLIKSLELQGDASDNFSDVKPTDYYYNALGTAKKLGLVLGTGANECRPDETITRQDMMVLAARALKLAGKNTQTGMPGELARYADNTSVSSYAAEDVSTMTREGIIKGDGDMLNPLNNATRAEAAVIIYRIYNK